MNLWEIIKAKHNIPSSIYDALWNIKSSSKEYEINVSGQFPLHCPNSIGKPIASWEIVGRTTQKSTPSITSPVDIDCVGDYDEASKKYIIEFVSYNNSKSESTYISLNSPLMQGEKLTRTKREKKYTKIVLTGNENWRMRGNHAFELSSQTLVNGKCTHFVSVYSEDINKKDSIYLRNTAAIIITIMDIDNVSSFKTWLQQQYANGTPVTIMAQVSTTTYEDVDLPEIKSVTGDMYLNTTTKAIPQSASVTYKSNKESEL